MQNGAAVLDAIFLPASEAEPHPRIAGGEEVELEQGSLVRPQQDVDLGPCWFVIVHPEAAGWCRAAHPGRSMALQDIGPLLLPLPMWGNGAVFVA